MLIKIKLRKKGERQMNILAHYEIQKLLMNRIEENHPANGEDRSAKKMLALIVEMAEAANDSRCFKFWMQDPKAKASLLEEVVDVYHFVLEHGIDKGFYVEENYTLFHEIEDPTLHFLSLIESAIQFFKNPREEEYRVLFGAFLGLVHVLGFGEDDLDQAYRAKNQENLRRQEENY
jgi:dimeric dUTPase (all-alpha-NTP-PPase superfamily)